MKCRLTSFAVAAALVMAGCAEDQPGPVAPGEDAVPNAARAGGNNGVNVVLKSSATSAILADLNTLGTVLHVLPEINAVIMRASHDALPAIQSRAYVKAAGPDRPRVAIPPLDPIPIADFANGLSTWNQDAINVTVQPLSGARAVPYAGDGVYVGVLDTGLWRQWRFFFPEERIAEEYAASFGGGGGNNGNVPEQPNKWERDTHGHGTHVTSIILGYNLLGTAFINGTAPKVTVIPVKVLNQPGFGWSSVIARGILHVASLKAGPLAGHPVVINMSLGGPVLDPVEQAAIDFAIAQGLIIVASAGNRGEQGMGYPGAYAPVISAAAAGWVEEWVGSRSWWLVRDVPEPTDPDDFYITDFSSRELAGQDLDVAAPGSWVVGPFPTNTGQVNSYFFVGGTSQASPHVAGIVALLAQKKPSLTAAEAESILESTALPLPPGTKTILTPFGTTETVTWGANATGSGLATANAALAAIP